jgi:hypothetical protein
MWFIKHAPLHSAVLRAVLISFYVGYSKSKERFAIKKYVLVIGKETNMHVVAHTFTNISV